MRSYIVGLVVVVAAIGCGEATEYDDNNGGNNGVGNNGPGNNGGNNGPGNNGNNGVPDAWFACGADADCVVFEAECCDHCNGGRAVAVNGDHLAEARDALAVPPASCEGVACTLRGCDELVGACQAGRCATATAARCADLHEEECVANPGCQEIRGAPAAEICADDWDRWNMVYGGCMEAGLGCGAAETCAIDPRTGNRSIFPSTCTPQGWAGCNTQPCDVAEACEDSGLTQPSMLCIGGPGGGDLVAGERIEVTVYPEGCFSSSCTRRVDVFCSVTDDLVVEANFCLADVDDNNQGCTEDCGGGGVATCYAPGLDPGSYTVTFPNGNGLDFEVPSQIPVGGLCTGR